MAFVVATICLEKVPLHVLFLLFFGHGVRVSMPKYLNSIYVLSRWSPSLQVPTSFRRCV